MAKNKYWETREKKWIQDNIKQDQIMAKGFKERYEELIKSITNEINSFYMNYAVRDHISMDEAVKKVGSFDVKDFEKTAAKMVKDKDFSKLANERLRVYNATMRINRLEMLKSKIGQELVAVDVETEKEIKGLLSDRYQEELARQAGILGGRKIDVPAKRLSQIVTASFNGATWSQRLWTAHTKLKANLDIIVTQAMIQGKNPKTLIADLMPLIDKNVGNRRYVAERLVISETARVQDQAQMDSFKAFGFEYCYWIAEPTACKDCLDIANAHDGLYKLSDVPGIPVHSSCRCSKSATTDKPGEKEYVPNFMNKNEADLATKWFTESGGQVLRDKNIDEYLDYIHATGITQNANEIWLHTQPVSRATVFEELYHATQFRENSINGSSRIDMEIEAQQYLLKNAKELKLSWNEIAQTRANLTYWKGAKHGENN